MPETRGRTLIAPNDFGETLREADALLARRNYPRAIDLLKRAVAASISPAGTAGPGGPGGHRGDSSLRLRLAEALAAGGRSAEAVTLFDEVARDLATAGFTAKAIAVYKRLQRLTPEAPTVERRLAELIRQRSQEISRPRPGAETADEPAPDLAAPAPLEVPAPAPAAAEATPAIALSPLFRSLESDELVELLRGFQLRTFHAGEIVVSEGESGDSLYVLASGEARVFVEGFDRRNRPVRRLAAGDFFGEISLLTGGVRTATVVAASELELLELSRAAVARIGARFPAVRATIQKFCLERAESPEEREARAPGSGPAVADTARAALLAAAQAADAASAAETPQIAETTAPRLEPDEIAALLPHARVRILAADETLFRRGESGGELYIVDDGEIEIRFDDGRPSKRVGPGEILGELALLTSLHQRTASAVAAVGARLISLDRDAWGRLREAHPALFVRLLERSCAYLVDSEQRLVLDLRRRNRELERVLDFLQRTKEELTTVEALAQTDDLTGVFNRRCFEEQVGRLVERANGGGLALALVVVDIDRFKQVNDTLGHPAGDLALRRLAQILRSSVRWTDLPCRIGGDEFAILWTDVDERSAARRARSMLPSLAVFDCELHGTEVAHEGNGGPVRLTASLGGALHRPGEGWEELYARADRGLYLAKRSGRGLLAWNEELLASPLPE